MTFEQQLYDFIESQGIRGATLSLLETRFPLSKNNIQPTLNTLRLKGEICLIAPLTYSIAMARTVGCSVCGSNVHVQCGDEWRDQ